ncbi:PKD domain-containing protein, partial [Flavobacteriales bacterium]|nr:PKD domain-containing protein [Flavobacteriales bacterium]
MLKKYIYILLAVLFSLFFSFESKGQCVVANVDIPDCIEIGELVTFLNISIDNNVCTNFQSTEYDWEIQSANGAYYWDTTTVGVSINVNPPIFLTTGQYFIYLDPKIPGQNGPCCPNTSNSESDIFLSFYVTDNPIIVEIDSITSICSGSSLDYNNIGLVVNNEVGSVSYSWEIFPIGSWNGLNPYVIPDNTDSIQLTVTDNTTGCTDTETIIIESQQTAITTPTIFFNPDTACAGTPISFYIDTPNTTQLSYEWLIQGVGYTGDSVSTSLIPSTPNVGENTIIYLIITEDSTDCQETFNETVTIASTPFIEIDTTLTPWDSELNGFNACFGTTFGNQTQLTFYNTNPSLIVDSILVEFPDTTLTFGSSGFSSFEYLFTQDNNIIFTVTPYNNGCYLTNEYKIFVTGGTPFSEIGLDYFQEGFCEDSTNIFAPRAPLLNEYITQLGPNDILKWEVSCGSSIIDEIIWNNDSVVDNIQTLPNGDTGTVFSYNFNDNSCGCTLYPVTEDKYIIKLTWIDYCDNEQDVFKSIQVVDPVEAAFEIDSSACVGDSIIFNNLSFAGCDSTNSTIDSTNYYFIWDFGDCFIRTDIVYGNTTTGNGVDFPDASHAYTQAGIYDVTLTAISLCGETDTTSQITVYPPPNVSFTFTDTICDNDLVSFNSNVFADSTYLRIDTCSLNPLDTNHITVPEGDTNFTYSWNFDDPNSLAQNTSSDSNPTHIFTACGTYYVSLLVSDNNGCDSLYLDTVIVYELPGASFSVPDVCEGTSSCIYDNSTVNTTNGCYGSPIYNWEYFITDDSTGLIIDTLYFDINDADADSCYLFTPPCDSTTESFTYTIELIVTDSLNCVDNRIKTTKIICTPDADFDTIAVCQGETKQFTNLSSPLNGMSWEWVIDSVLGNYASGFDEFDRHPKFIFDTCGTFEITLFQIDPDTLLGSSCNDSVTKQIIVLCLPEASFTSDIICQGDSTELISTSLQGSQPSGPITDWNWSVNTINNDTNYHVFTNCDSTNVTLTVTDSASCTNTFNDNIFVKCNPIADIFAENQCFDNQPISFIDTSSEGTGTIDSWYWEITGGNYLTGDTSSTQYPSFIFDSCGIYTAYLTVNDSLECSNIDSINVEVYCLPEAIFSVENVCEDLVTPFDGTASTAVIDTFIWILSNGYTDTTTTPIWNDYQFSNCGNYSADLFVIDNHGCTDSSITMDFDVYCPPIANFEFDSVCEGTATAIWGTSQTGNSPSAPINTWDWNFDGTTEIDSSFTHTFSNCGPFPVTLTVSDTNNCTSPTLPIDIFVKCNPDAEIFAQDGCFNNQPISFIDTSINGTGTIDTWNWTILDGLYSSPDTNTTQNPSFTFNSCGNKTVYLEVTDSLNCTDTDSFTVEIYCLPEALFTFTNVCLDSTMYFTNQSTPVVPILYWNWDFGDGTPNSNDTNPSHTYGSCGDYNVTLTITDSLGCIVIYEDSVTIYCPPVIASFYSNTGGVCEGSDSAWFNSAYNVGDTAIASWLWEFGDGTNSTDSGFTNFNIYDTCNTSNPLIATYTIIDNNGCLDYDTTDIEIFCAPELTNVNSDGESVCLGENSAFSTWFNNFYPLSYYEGNWDFGNGEDSTFYDPNFMTLLEYEYPDSGSYTAVITITDTIHNCPSIDSVDIRIHPNPTAEITADPECFGDSTSFVVTYHPGDSSIANYNWTFPNSTANFSSTNFSYYFNNCGFDAGDTNFVSLELIGGVEGDNGIICHSDTTIPVILYCLPSISLLPVSDTCEGLISAISFDTTSGTNPIEIWNWDYGGSIISSDDSSYVLYSSCDDYLLTVEVQDSAGCSASDSDSVTVLCNTIPELTLLDSSTCGNEIITISVSDTTLSYYWLPTLNSSQPTNQDWIINYDIPYNLGPDSLLHIVSVYEEDNFCSSTTYDTVTVYPIPSIDFVIDTFSCSPLILNTPNNYSDPNNGSETINSMTFEWYLNTTLQNDTLHLIDTLLNTNIDDTTCYDIVIIGTTQHGCIDSSSNEICIKPDPIAEINFSDTCLCAPFNISSLNITGNYYDINDSTYWQVFDSSGNLIDSSSGLIPQIVTVQNASDFITMVFYAINSCDTVSDTLTICSFEDPVSIFSLGGINQGNSPLTVFADTTGLGVTQGATYIWTVSDINGAILETYTTYVDSFTLTNTSPTLDSIYVISLQVINSNGCDSSSSDTVTINPSPSSGFILSADSICPDDIITVIDTSNANPSITYLWTISPNAFITDSSSDSTGITFPNNLSGNTIVYTITLYITDSITGYLDSTYQYVYVYSNPIALFNITTDACGPETLTPTNNSSFQDSCLWTASSATVGI